jgi:hypothetical protein
MFCGHLSFDWNITRSLFERLHPPKATKDCENSASMETLERVGSSSEIKGPKVERDVRSWNYYERDQAISNSIPARPSHQQFKRNLQDYGSGWGDPISLAGSSLLQLSLEFGAANCSERRDKIFGLHSLASICCQIAIPVDYSIPLRRICAMLLHHVTTLRHRGPDLNFNNNSAIDVAQRLQRLLFGAPEAFPTLENHLSVDLLLYTDLVSVTGTIRGLISHVSPRLGGVKEAKFTTLRDYSVTNIRSIDARSVISLVSGATRRTKLSVSRQLPARHRRRSRRLHMARTAHSSPSGYDLSIPRNGYRNCFARTARARTKMSNRWKGNHVSVKDSDGTLFALLWEILVCRGAEKILTARRILISLAFSC